MGRHGQPPGVIVDGHVVAASGEHGASVGEDGLVVDDDLDALAAHLGLELVRGSPGDDLAVVDHRDRVGQLVGLFEVLGRQQERGTAAHQLADHIPHAEAASRVETGRGFVEDQQPRLGDERRREIEPAAHAARVGLHDPVGRIGQVELVEQLVGAGPGLRGRQLVQSPEQPQVLAAGEVLIDCRVLTGQADEPADLVGLANHVESGNGGASGIGLEERGQDPDGRGLARAVRAKEPEDGPLGDLEIDTVEGVNLALAALVDLDQALGRDRRGGHDITGKRMGGSHRVPADGYRTWQQSDAVS